MVMSLLLCLCNDETPHMEPVSFFIFADKFVYRSTTQARRENLKLTQLDKLRTIYLFVALIIDDMGARVCFHLHFNYNSFGLINSDLLFSNFKIVILGGNNCKPPNDLTLTKKKKKSIFRCLLLFAPAATAAPFSSDTVTL